MVKWMAVGVLVLLSGLLGCDEESASLSSGAESSTLQDVTDTVESSGDALVGSVDSLPPFPSCQCVVDGDCVNQFFGLGPCQKVACDVEQCQCVALNIPEGESCDDQSVCTSETVCEQGHCGGGIQLDCEDDNVCTDDICDAGDGCIFSFNTSMCDDGDPCSAEDRCVEGECASSVPTACDDENECTVNGCTYLEGCQFLPHGGACDDGSLCTAGDLCEDGECQPGDSFVCDDDNPCTVDSCVPEEGCVTEPSSGQPCDDGDNCTLASLCQMGVCVPEEVELCDDGDACTVDVCSQLGCLHMGETCQDGNACTDESCDGESGCLFGQVNCDDGNACTEDSCQPESGCFFYPGSWPCDDGNPCTVQDRCVHGLCSGGIPWQCDDGDVCTEDSCSVEEGCAFVAVTGPLCNDDNACTQEDTCVSGECVAEEALVCDDGDVCTTDRCDPTQGCLFEPNQHGCEDGLFCTVQDVCEEGFCMSGLTRDCEDGDPCTENWCLEGLGCVKEWQEGLPCDDGLSCNGSDQCGSEGCLGGPCGCDSNTDCEAVSGCFLSASCVEGACVFTDPVVCEEDSNPCTETQCDPTTKACVVTALLQALCDDGDVCTGSDHCEEGTCVGEATLCDDGQECTEDGCDPATGACVFAPLSGISCTAGSGCSVASECVAGKCIPPEGACLASCSDATPLTCGGSKKEQALSGESFLDTYACSPWPYYGSERIYEITVEVSQTITIEFDGPESLGFMVLAGGEGECDPSQCVGHGLSSMPLAVEAGLSYWLVVDSLVGISSSFAIGVSCDPPSPVSGCLESDVPGCAGCLCEECVCDQDPACCTEGWSEACAVLCDDFCDGCPDPSSGCVASSLPGASVEECETCVCEVSPLCCSVAWDGLCVLEATQGCGESCGCPGFENECCGSSTHAGCKDPDCMFCVCDLDPSCCDSMWDGSCVDKAFFECGDHCACVAGEESCCNPSELSGCNEAACQECVCAENDFCCLVSWDGLCAGLAEEGCEQSCTCAQTAEGSGALGSD